MSTEMPVKSEVRKPASWINKFAASVLRSPLGSVLGKRLMLITFKGRKSGKEYTIPVGYERNDNVVTCLTNHKWWKNLLAHPEVTLLLKRNIVSGRAEVIYGEVDLIANELEKRIKQSPRLAQEFNVELDATKQPTPESIRQAAQYVAFIRISIA